MMLGNRSHLVRASPAVCPAGCADGYGLFFKGSKPYSYSEAQGPWKEPHTPFYCKQCPPGEVPFLPGSNLELVWDGTTWTLQLVDQGGSRRGRRGGRPGSGSGMHATTAAAHATQLAKAASAAGLAATKAAGGNAGAAATTASTAAESAGTQAAATQAVEPQGSYGQYDHGYYPSYPSYPSHPPSYPSYPSYPDHGYDHVHDDFKTPLYPGQCVACPDGSYQVDNSCKF
jgi:hypothetical protein